MHFNKKDLFTIPNIMTYARFVMVPAFIVVYMSKTIPYAHWWALGIVALSALTDVLDGIVARKTGQITDLGKILDPIADKAIEFAMLFCVVTKYPWIALLIIIFGAKELISLGFSGYLFANKKNIDGAMWCGKLCTVILYAVMIAFIVLPDIPHPIDYILIGVAAVFMFIAFIVYMNAYLKLLRELKAERKMSENNQK